MKKRKHKNGEELNYWQSYSDMMAALLLMFVLIMAVTLLQSLKSYEDKLKEKEEQLKIQQEQQDKLVEQQKLLDDQQEQIDNLVGIKARIIEVLSKEFKDTDLIISVDQKTGAIAFDASILFDFNESKLKESGKEYLNKFLPVYFSVLSKMEFRDYVSEIIIEGHTDNQGSYLYNLELSQNRALSVASYCLTDEGNKLTTDEREQLREMLTANGKSFTNLVYKEDGLVDEDASRRVEFKFRLKDDEMIDELRKLLEE